MFHRIRALVHEIRLDLRRAWLRGRERGALRRLGRGVVESRVDGGDEEVRRLTEEVGTALARIGELRAASGDSLAADRADLATVPVWLQPAVILRGLCARLVLRQRRAAVRRTLQPVYEAIGARAAERAEFWYSLEREVTAVRAGLARVSTERRRWVAPYGDTALPGWSGKAGEALRGFGRSVHGQLRSDFLPKAPALAGLAVGWWVANTYTDSHLQSALRSIGVGSGGTRVVSSSTYQAMSFWLPLLSAVLCGYLGERIAGFYRMQDGPGEGVVTDGPSALSR